VLLRQSLCMVIQLIKLAIIVVSIVKLVLILQLVHHVY
jgi:hypothetical protein